VGAARSSLTVNNITTITNGITKCSTRYLQIFPSRHAPGHHRQLLLQFQGVNASAAPMTKAMLSDGRRKRRPLMW
jgi:hypothetical protein